MINVRKRGKTSNVHERFFSKNKNVMNRLNFIQARNTFIKIKRSAKRKQRIQHGKDVCDMAKKQPRAFLEEYLEK